MLVPVECGVAAELVGYVAEWVAVLFWDHQSFLRDFWISALSFWDSLGAFVTVLVDTVGPAYSALCLGRGECLLLGAPRAARCPFFLLSLRIRLPPLPRLTVGQSWP